MARNLTDAWLRGELRDLFPLHPSSAADRRRAVERAWRPLAPAVAEAIEAQNGRWATSPARDAHLAALRRGAAAVVTGQQVGLFLGPLYTLYKAATAIRMARVLADETGREVVPVFWLQTEDHDLPEIAWCGLPGPEGEAIEVSLPAGEDVRSGQLGDGDRISIAHRRLPEAVAEKLTWLRDELAPHARGDHLDRLARHYRPGAGWGEAFAGLLAELFAGEGLVLVDPRDPALARAVAEIHRRSVVEAAPIAEKLAARAASLRERGFDVAVHVRPGAPLSFFHPRGAEGPRYRLEPAPGGLAEVGGAAVHDARSILDAIDADPLRVSTSALLRPIVQDELLPTAAYVGGPGELAYFAQLSPLYDHFGMAMPMVALRARFQVIERRTARLLDRLGLQPGDVARGEEELLARCSRGGEGLPDPAALASELLGPLEERLASFASVAAGLQGMPRGLERTRRTVERAVERLRRRYATALARRDERLVADVRKLKGLLHPQGLPQERFHGLPWYGVRYGDRAFVRLVLDAIRPFDPTPGVLRL